MPSVCAELPAYAALLALVLIAIVVTVWAMVGKE